MLKIKCFSFFPASSLQCYTCTSQSSNTNCMVPTNCSASDTSCMTSVVAGGIGGFTMSTITKTCEAICKESGLNAGIVSSKVSCCSTNLCNTSGASSIKSTYIILVVALGFLVTLLRQ
ncbi:lymphocyte antigen 6E-like [Pyxicephalus adspersus]|uniref:UPAR/Ly6 domain-containing protein n=1 Tax=Pyxicephalus adspersus TaxID=30357 RepID=A0AAV3AFT5_PYXAD|nr:TPA: hypothetical protein GDO54_011615 [Pyxicephalus adspersus]